MESKSTGKTVAIVILLLAVLGLGGYIIYDKALIKETKKTEKPTNMVEKKNDNDALNNDLALGLGQSLYSDAMDLYNQCTVGDGNNMFYYSNGKMRPATQNDGNNGTESNGWLYYLISSDKTNKLTQNAADNYKKLKGILFYENEYYVSDGWGDCLQGRMSNLSKLLVKNISKNKIEYDVTEYYCKNLENYDKCEKNDKTYLNEIKTTFVITNENNKWKIDKYEDSSNKNYELNNQ